MHRRATRSQYKAAAATAQLVLDADRTDRNKIAIVARPKGLEALTLIRSRKQRPLRTCDLPVDGANPWVHASRLNSCNYDLSCWG
jgi:hypothetical protein